MQQALIQLGSWLDVSTRRFGTPDGIYGDETASRVYEFQSQHHLHPDGITGRHTLAALDQLLPNPGPKLPPLPRITLFSHKFCIHIRTLTQTTTLPFSSQEANARMVFAQHGIGMETVSSMSFALSPEEEKALIKNVDVGTCIDENMTKELRFLHSLGLQGVGVNEIVVYFVPRLIDETGQWIYGCSASARERPAIVVASGANPWTMAHELGHLLLGHYSDDKSTSCEDYSEGHSTDKTNLMYEDARLITANPPGLTPDQLYTITQREGGYCSKF